ncbi:hypothetical protein [Actinoallomurus iriomotensis]|uniref:Uncharacterized protein n=1 Tax=Actinoallomurus iriomotensis TaxID=478107 RepID=A0A9W6S8C0_9ACTN|nr:hypothetical protein [Actinoallomurus iriomotensis]GLY88919.1 hypothetical protein Airi02_068480 [Actinoallomurus iriomotensis]
MFDDAEAAGKGPKVHTQRSSGTEYEWPAAWSTRLIRATLTYPYTYDWRGAILRHD